MNSTQHCRSLAISFCFAILLLFACNGTNKEQEKASASNIPNEHAQADTLSGDNVVKAEAPDTLVTYVNFPTTEYLRLPFLDFYCFNVYLERREDLQARAAVPILAMQVKGPEFTPATRRVVFRVPFGRIGIEVKKNSCPIAVERI